jgi:hypothetical protein
MSRKGSNSHPPPSGTTSSFPLDSTNELDDGFTAEERAATEADVQAMLDAVQAELQQSGAEHAAASSSIGEGHTLVDGEEEDNVSIADHLNMSELKLEDRDEAASNTNSQSNSVSASPAITSNGALTLIPGSSSPSVCNAAAPPASSAEAAVASAAALSALPPVELKDGGNAALPASSDVHIGSKKNFFDVRVAVVGNVDSGTIHAGDTKFNWMIVQFFDTQCKLV